MPNSLENLLNRPIVVGNRTIKNRLFLAPMTCLGNVALRELVADFGGCGLMFSEMCSAKRIPHENRNVSLYYRWRDEELPFLVCQIVGGDAQIMATAAAKIEAQGFFGVDINFGCSASSICRQNIGAALLKEPERAVRIVENVRKAVSIPLFVKFRTGWVDDPRISTELAKQFENAGADALTFHPRVAPDRRTRPPKWEYIGLLKDAVSIPVFGNGNVFSQADCLNIMEKTGCDGVSIGRMAITRPWIFAAWSKGFKPDLDIYPAVAEKILSLLAKHFDSRAALRRLKKFAPYFAANFRFGHSLFSKLSNVTSLDAGAEVFASFFENNPETTSNPKVNLFC